jgi:hypothetical protein
LPGSSRPAARRLGPDLTVSLIGRDHEKLHIVAAAVARRCPGLRVVAAVPVAAGVRGADLVLNQVWVGGLEGRAWDEKAPSEFGMIGEETVGAGGLALGFRTLPVVRRSPGRSPGLAPGAWFVNLTCGRPPPGPARAGSLVIGIGMLGWPGRGRAWMGKRAAVIRIRGAVWP